MNPFAQRAVSANGGGTGTGAYAKSSTHVLSLNEQQYQALRRLVGVRFCLTPIGDEYAILAKSVGKSENQIINTDWQTLGGIFADEFTSAV